MKKYEDFGVCVLQSICITVVLSVAIYAVLSFSAFLGNI